VITAVVEQFPPDGQFEPLAAANEKSDAAPRSEIVFWPLLALSVMLMLASRLPVPVGAKVTLNWHFAWPARLAELTGHVLVCLKSLLFVPVMAMLEIISGLLPVLVSVITWAALVIPTCEAANVRPEGLKLARGAGTAMFASSEAFMLLMLGTATISG
jgi:hypothetical protein